MKLGSVGGMPPEAEEPSLCTSCLCGWVVLLESLRVRNGTPASTPLREDSRNMMGRMASARLKPRIRLALILPPRPMAFSVVRLGRIGAGTWYLRGTLRPSSEALRRLQNPARHLLHRTAPVPTAPHSAPWCAQSAGSPAGDPAALPLRSRHNSDIDTAPPRLPSPSGPRRGAVGSDAGPFQPDRNGDSGWGVARCARRALETGKLSSWRRLSARGGSASGITGAVRLQNSAPRLILELLPNPSREVCCQLPRPHGVAGRARE